MSTAAEKIKLSELEYLESEKTAEFKNEYLQGEIWAMAGASDNHVTIAMNLAFLLKQQLKGNPCRSYISDMKVKIELANAFFYPDVFVSCDPRDQEQDFNYYKERPVFIAEVLSPSTEAYDRGDKFKYYQLLPGLQEYWLIDAQKMTLDCFTRADDNAWTLHSYSSPQDQASIVALNLTIQLDQLYVDTNI
ncbi:Uma2 family endonuclease [Methyloprofundus sp.]|uniref:Uma2 family endonuclease n=1 Tax=Methyloprofundus sp. TaxID=2020875 RepID=UPI003D144997